MVRSHCPRCSGFALQLTAFNRGNHNPVKRHQHRHSYQHCQQLHQQWQCAWGGWAVPPFQGHSVRKAKPARGYRWPVEVF